jgi:DNA primase
MDTHKDWVDFRLIKQAVSMPMVLDHYGINWLRKKDDELRGRCPIHHGQGERSFHVNLTKNAYQCFSCKSKGNVLDLVAAMEGCSVRDAALKLKAWFKVGESESPPPQVPATAERNKAASKVPAVINPPLSFQLRVNHAHEYGLSRGLTKETLEYFGAGLCLSKGTFSGRFVIPLHNEVGELVGYAGRSIDDREPKYLFPSSEKGFQKRYLLFNLHRVLREIPKASRVVLVEGFISTMKLNQAGYSALAMLGSSISAEQEELLAGHFEQVILLMDGDSAGQAATDDCLLRLGRRLWVRAIALPEGVQPDQLSESELHQVLNLPK